MKRIRTVHRLALLAKPLRSSILPELNRAGNTLLPAEDRVEAPPAPVRCFSDALRAAGTEAMQREFTAPFDFDSDYLTLHTTGILSRGQNRQGHANRRARCLRNDVALEWSKLIETASSAEKRARKVGELFVGRGLAAASVNV